MKIRPAKLDCYTKSLNLALWSVVSVGIVLRILRYCSDRSLWGDEISLAVNIIGRSYEGLTKPLDYMQGAPLGFLFLEKSATGIFGNNELALRLIPLIAGICALPLFLLIVRRLFMPWEALFATILFAVSEPLLYYSSEVKQYSCDVFICMLLLYGAVRYMFDDRKTGSLIFLGIGGLLGLWISHTSIFVMAGIGTTLFVREISRRQYTLARNVAIVGTCWVIGFALVYVFLLKELHENPEMMAYWKKEFLPFPPKTFEEFWWFTWRPVLWFVHPVGLKYAGLGAVLCLIGVFRMSRGEEKWTLGLVAGPILFAAIASALGKYPLEERLILFMAPLFIILITAGIGYISIRDKTARLIVRYTLCFALLFHPVTKAVIAVAQPPSRHETKPLLKHIEENWQDDDVLYIYWAAYQPFFFYRDYSDEHILQNVEPVIGIDVEDDWWIFEQDLQPLKQHKRVWVLFSNLPVEGGQYEKRMILAYLDRMSNRIERVQEKGASVYLYEQQGK